MTMLWKWSPIILTCLIWCLPWITMKTIGLISLSGCSNMKRLPNWIMLTVLQKRQLGQLLGYRITEHSAIFIVKNDTKNLCLSKRAQLVRKYSKSSVRFACDAKRVPSRFQSEGFLKSLNTPRQEAVPAVGRTTWQLQTSQPSVTGSWLTQIIRKTPLELQRCFVCDGLNDSQLIDLRQQLKILASC